VNAPALDHEAETQKAKPKESVTVRGAGELSGGEYDRVRVFGSGAVIGDLCAQHIRSVGGGKFRGRVETGSLSIIGAGEFAADLVAEDVKGIGALSVKGRLEANRLLAVGACAIGGRVFVEEVKTVGALNCTALEATSCRVRGGVEIEGLLSADTVLLHIGGGHSRVGDIGGERVEVWRSNFGKRNPLLKALGALMINLGVFGTRSSLQARTIEADEVTLENTRADVVRGKRVEIGPRCEIGRVEYSETLRVHASAKLTEEQKI